MKSKNTAFRKAVRQVKKRPVVTISSSLIITALLSAVGFFAHNEWDNLQDAEKQVAQIPVLIASVDNLSKKLDEQISQEKYDAGWIGDHLDQKQSQIFSLQTDMAVLKSLQDVKNKKSHGW